MLEINDYHSYENRIWLTYVLTSKKPRKPFGVFRFFFLEVSMIIKKAEYLISAVKYPKELLKNLPEFIFIGRSNVGKSSLLNALTNRKQLAYTSSKPGKTMTLNFFMINDQIIFVDAPGYGYAKKKLLDRLAYGKMIENYLKTANHLKTCFLVIDARHEPTENDLLMYNYLKENNLPVAIIATKIDKLSKAELANNMCIFKKIFNLESDENLLAVSALKKTNLEKLTNYIETFINN